MSLFQEIKKMRISIKSYDVACLDAVCEQILCTTENSNLKARGPVRLPTNVRKYCLLTSPHVNKDAREQFEIRTHKCVIDILNPNQTVVRKFKNLTFPAGVNVDIKNFN
jgi:small subunit ribosomal protein S10